MSINPMIALQALREDSWWPDDWGQGEENA